MNNHFEVVKKYKNSNINIPTMATNGSAGFDLEAAETVIIKPYIEILRDLREKYDKDESPVSLEELKNKIKDKENKPTLVSTGLKCYLEDGYYLELSVRSSTPLKYWLVMANSVGIIDSDYVDSDNGEGEIFLQLINLSPWPIVINKGDKIAQGIIKPYWKPENVTDAKRNGGLGSTTTVKIPEPKSK